MRRLFLAIAILALIVPVAEKAKAEVSINFFYDTLGNYGNWVEVPTYGYVWQPTVAAGSTSWRPYADGYWAYTDQGWTWVSYEDFGWATYHYGRWMRLRDRGWFWVPGYTWAPAWVSWRTGGDYIGWAPLPPDFRDEVVYEGRPVYGYVDAEYDIGPAYYNFVDIRYIGEPVLRERIFEPAQNVVYMERTVNVTNITYNNDAVYNYGPDYNIVSAYSTRPVLRMALQRENVADPVAAAQNGALVQKRGDKLVVAAPAKLDTPTSTPPPKVVKEKIAQPTIEKGWSGITDASKVAQLKEKLKAENPKQVPPPDIKPRVGASLATAPGASPPTPAAPPTAAAARIGASPAGKGQGKNQHGANAATTAPPASSAKPKRKDKHVENGRPNQAVPPGIAPRSDAAREARPPVAVPQAQHGKAQGNKASAPQVAPNPEPSESRELQPQRTGKRHGHADGAPDQTMPTVAPQLPSRAFLPEGQREMRRPEIAPQRPMPQSAGPAAGGPPRGQQHPGKGGKPNKGGPEQSPPPGH